MVFDLIKSPVKMIDASLPLLYTLSPHHDGFLHLAHSYNMIYYTCLCRDGCVFWQNVKILFHIYKYNLFARDIYSSVKRYPYNYIDNLSICLKQDFNLVS